VVGGRYVTLGTDGFGRSDSRAALRRHFEVDRTTSPWQRSRRWRRCHRDQATVSRAIEALGVDPAKPVPGSLRSGPDMNAAAAS